MVPDAAQCPALYSAWTNWRKFPATTWWPMRLLDVQAHPLGMMLVSYVAGNFHQSNRSWWMLSRATSGTIFFCLWYDPLSMVRFAPTTSRSQCKHYNLLATGLAIHRVDLSIVVELDPVHNLTSLGLMFLYWILSFFYKGCQWKPIEPYSRKWSSHMLRFPWWKWSVMWEEAAGWQVMRQRKHGCSLRQTDGGCGRRHR